MNTRSDDLSFLVLSLFGMLKWVYLCFICTCEKGSALLGDHSFLLISGNHKDLVMV